jgi:phage shock protein A
VGIFSKIKNGISSKANAALDKAIDPEKELDMAIMELEEQRKKALQELISYKATAKQLDQDIEKYTARATEWERRAMVAVRAGDDDAAKLALKEKKNALVEIEKIKRDKAEATSYAVQLNKSRKVFEVKLQTLKLRKGTLATQIAAARAGGDAFGNDQGVWDKFKEAEDRIDAEAIETEVDASLRGEELAQADFDQKLIAATGGSMAALKAGGDTEDQLAAIKAKVDADRAARAARLGTTAKPALPAGKTEGAAVAAAGTAAAPAAGTAAAAAAGTAPAPAAAAAAGTATAAGAGTAEAETEAREGVGGRPAPVSPPIDPASTEALLAKLKAELAGGDK